LEHENATLSVTFTPTRIKEHGRPDSGPQLQTVLANRYLLLGRLGAGGMGVVYKAKDQRLERLVALKLLIGKSFADAEHKARFLREARAAASLDHPNICTVYEIDETEEHAFIAMAYLSGQSLKEKARGGISIREAIQIAADAASALAYAHARGVVHRDIKPGNLFITAEGVLKIIDFGLATIAGDATLTIGSTLIGTPAYMSPEQANAERVDHRTDIWSLGVVLYEMITGKLPFPGTTLIPTLYGVVNKDYEPVLKLRESAPPQLETIIATALSKTKEHRYPSMREFLYDLRGLAESEGSVMVAPGEPQSFGSVASIAVTTRSSTHSSSSGPSVAVLPFVDMSSSRDQEYLCEGIAEDIINALMQVKGLRVVSRGSSFRFSGKSYDLAEVSRKLRVSTLLEGSVRRDQDRLRISVHLIDAGSGDQIWSQRYDRGFKDVFAVQDEISAAVAGALSLKLVEQPQLMRATDDIDAYSAYLKGRYFWSKRTGEGAQRAIEFYQEALRTDPHYAPALAGLADAYILPGYYGTAPPSIVMPKGRDVALRALELNPRLAEGRASLGAITAIFDHDWAESERQFQLAIESNANYPTAHSWYGIFCLVPLRRFKEASAHMSAAQRLDPLTPFVSTIVGMYAYFKRDYAAAIEALQRVTDLDPAFPTAYVYLGRALLESGQTSEALAALSKGLQLNPRNPMFIAHWGHACAVTGDWTQAESVLAELANRSLNSYVPASSLALIELGLGNANGTIGLLERANRERDLYCIWFAADPIFDRIRTDSRFEALVREIGL
jgi:serine/threonine protein kinase/tetratricopeptide (TPR) repeat protein